LNVGINPYTSLLGIYLLLEREQCEALFTKEELLFALRGLQTGKAPGSDGLPTEFYLISPIKRPRYPISLVFVYHKMNYFKETTGNNPRSNFIINIQDSNLPPITRIKTVTFLKGQRDNTSALRKEREPESKQELRPATRSAPNTFQNLK